MSVQDGMIGGVQTTLTKAMIDGAFTAIAWYNVIELNIIIFMTFKRRRGLYFYSLLVSSWGIAVYALASIMKFYRVWQNDYISVTFITIGWYAMVTGQSLVQYSRLYLVFHDRHKIKWVLWMIIVNFFLFHVPTTVMTFGTNSSLVDMFSTPYSIMEKVQVTAFTIQESIISGLYVYKTQQILRPTFQKNRARRVMIHLIIVNVLIILMDLTLLCTEYANQYEIETTYKGALYSVKLRLEFAVLSQLMSLIGPDHTASEHDHSAGLGGIHMETVRQSRASRRPKMETTIFAGATDQLKVPESTHKKGVMLTTEIAMNHELVQQPHIEAKKFQDGSTPNLSPASSQVELARNAY